MIELWANEFGCLILDLHNHVGEFPVTVGEALGCLNFSRYGPNRVREVAAIRVVEGRAAC